jgi:hypothetical protein
MEFEPPGISGIQSEGLRVNAEGDAQRSREREKKNRIRAIPGMEKNVSANIRNSNVNWMSVFDGAS